MKILLNTLVATLLITSVPAWADRIRLDHVIVAVDDIEKSIKTYQHLGFTIKPGKIHKNGLMNAHIKFQNRTEIELMSIAGVPTDDVAKRYYEFLKGGEGGAYIAFSGVPTKKAIYRLNSLGIHYRVITGRLWNYITFYNEPDLEHIFFIDMHHSPTDNPAIFKHKNGSSHIEGIWFEATAAVRSFLKAFGAVPCGKMLNKSVPAGDMYRIENTTLIAVSPRSNQKRPRILGIVFNGDGQISASDAHGIWMNNHTDITCTLPAHDHHTRYRLKN